MPPNASENKISLNQQMRAFFSRFAITNPFARKALLVLIFLVGAHCFYSYVGIYKYLPYRPCSIHSWAQCQRASIAQNYYKTDMNFFKPRVQRFSRHGGITGVEFPAIYYAAAVMYKMFGFNEVFLRGIGLLIVSMGLFLFYLLANRFVKNAFMSLAIVGSAAFSPVFLFYTPNFLPDAPAVGLVLCAWFFFFRYIQSGSRIWLNSFLFMATLASLIKVISLMCLVVIICLLVLDKLKFFRSANGEQIFKDHLRIFGKIAGAVLVVFAWYFYADWLSKKYENTTFLLGTMTGYGETFSQVVQGIKSWWRYEYYSYESYVLMLSALILAIVGFKFLNRLLATITFLYILGCVCYVYLFLGQFINHDYYIISILPAVFFLLLTLGDAVNTFSDRYFIPLKFVFFMALFFNAKECIPKCKKVYNHRYSRNSSYYSSEDRAYYDLEKKMRTAGIKRTDLTISAFDNTFCNTLYWMDQVGIIVERFRTREEIAHILRTQGARYLVLNDSAAFNKVYPNDFSKHILFTHRGLIVYKLK